MKTVDLLIRARDIISKGWFQGTYSDSGCTRYCILGAIHKAAGTDQESCEQTPPVARCVAYVNAVTGDDSVYEFNDAPGRTNTEVLQALDYAIRNAKRRHKNGLKLHCK